MSVPFRCHAGLCASDEDIDHQRIGDYTCPYCEKPNVFRLPGRILGATATPDGPSRPRIVRDRPQ